MSDHNTSIQSKEGNGISPFWILAGILFVILVVVLGGMTLSHSSNATEMEDADRAAVRIKNLADLQAADTALLTSYGWINQAKGVVHVPITHAMELVLPKLNATPTPTPLPAPVTIPATNEPVTNAASISPGEAIETPTTPNGSTVPKP